MNTYKGTEIYRVADQFNSRYSSNGWEQKPGINRVRFCYSVLCFCLADRIRKSNVKFKLKS